MPPGTLKNKDFHVEKTEVNTYYSPRSKVVFKRHFFGFHGRFKREFYKYLSNTSVFKDQFGVVKSKNVSKLNTEQLICGKLKQLFKTTI